MSDIHNPGRINSLKMKNFAKFKNTSLDFKNLNVIVGENGVGKTHLLKLLYSALAATQKPDGQQIEYKSGTGKHIPRSTSRPTIGILESQIAQKLAGVHRPEGRKVGRLVRRQQGHRRCDIHVGLEDDQKSIGFSFTTNSSTKVTINQCPDTWYDGTPVFLPTHELLSIYPGFTWLYEKYQTEFDETWYDTCKLLGAPPVRGRRSMDINELLGPLQQQLGGKIVFKDDRFYLRGAAGTLESPLVAEGLRKVGMLWYLITTKQLENVSCLFWDEPEANLNPKIIRTVAEAISLISKFTQVFLATHSVFLLKQFEILRKQGKQQLSIRYFALSKEDDTVVVKPADDIYDVEPWVALEETNNQSLSFIKESAI